MRFRMSACAPLAALALLVAAGGARGHAPWFGPEPLTVPGFAGAVLPGADPSVAAANARGVQAFIWEGQGTAEDRSYVGARWRLADGRLTAPRAVSRRDQVVADAVVGLDARGQATVVWTGGKRSRRYGTVSDIGIMVVVGRPGESFGAPVRVAATSDFTSSEPKVAVAPNGSAVVLWRGRDGLRAARRPPGDCPPSRARGCFGRPQRLPAGVDHTVAFGPRDTAYATWAVPAYGSARQRTARIQLATAPRGRPFTAPRRISRAGVAVRKPAIAVAPDGSVLLAWRRGDNETPVGAIETAVYAADGRVSPPQPIGAAGASPLLRLTGRGEAILVWEQFRLPYDDFEVAAAVRPPGGAFGPPEALSSPNAYAAHPWLAVDRGGRAVVAWHVPGPPDRFLRPTTSVIARLRAPGAGFGAPITVAPAVPPG